MRSIRDSKFPGTGFNATLRPLRDAGPNDPEFQLSAEFFRYSYKDKELGNAFDFAKYGGWVRTHFYSDNGYPIDVLVIAGGSELTANSDGPLDTPSSFGDRLDHDVRVYWDHPLVEARIDCAAKAWQLVAPRVAEVRKNDGFSYGTVNGSCLQESLDFLWAFNEELYEEQLSFCDAREE